MVVHFDALASVIISLRRERRRRRATSFSPVPIIPARFGADLNRLLSAGEPRQEQIARAAFSNMYAVYPDTGADGNGRKRTSHPAVYPVSLLAALGKAVPALSHRQQWANSEPIMSDHCHVPEPTHVDHAQPRSTGQARAGTKGAREGGGGGRASLQVIAQITRDPSYPRSRKSTLESATQLGPCRPSTSFPVPLLVLVPFRHPRPLPLAHEESANRSCR